MKNRVHIHAWASIARINLIGTATLLFGLLLLPATQANAEMFDEDSSWIDIPEGGMLKGEITEAFGKDLQEREEFDRYQWRPLSITVWRGISPWGTNSSNVINNVVIGLSKDEMARLEGIGVALLSSFAYEHVYGFQYGTFGAIAAENLVGIQLSLAGSVAGENSYGAQLGGLGAVAGRDVVLLQAAGMGAVAGRDLWGAQIGGLGAVTGRTMTGFQFAIAGAVAGTEVYGAQVGGLAAVSGGDVIGMQLGGLAGVSGRDVSGVQFGGLAAVAGGDVKLLQIGGLAAVSGRRLNGVQVAGMAAVSAKDGWGMTIAGLAGVVDGDFRGIQASGLVNATTGRFYGVQVGSINFASEQRSLQVGGVNAAEELNGLQIGLSNGVYNNYGVMIGLMNSIEGEAKGVHIAPITQIEGELKAVNLYYESSGFANIDYVTGNRAIRSIFSLGFANWQDPERWMIGGGIGHQFELVPETLDFEVDLLGYKMNENEFWTDDHNYLTRMRGHLMFKYSDSNYIFAGASYNYLTSKVSDGSDMEVIALDDNNDGEWFHRSWIGYEVGIRITYDRLDFWNIVY